MSGTIIRPRRVPFEWLLTVRDIMLIIARKVGQSIIIGDGLRVTVLKIQGHAIELGLEDLFKKTSLQNISVSFDQKVQICEGVSILVWAKTKKGQQVALALAREHRELSLMSKCRLPP